MEPSREVDLLAHRVIGAAIEVHRDLGPGYAESVYSNALAYEMSERGIPFEREKPVQVAYRGQIVGEYRMDFLIDGKLIVELKAVETVLPLHMSQVISYLKVTRLPLALLLNFNVQILKDGIRRIVLS